MARPRVAAGALIRDHAGRLLLVRPSYKDGWDIPGGYVEPDETPSAACEREVAEEIGLVRPAGQLLVVDWAPSDTEGDKVLFVFDGGRVDAAEADNLAIDGSEIEEIAFHPDNELSAMMPARLARRLALAVEASRSSTTIYAEHGYVYGRIQVPDLA